MSNGNVTYWQTLRAYADRLRNWDNCENGNLHLNEDLNKEMGRLFGVLDYEEHKALRQKASHDPRFQQCTNVTEVQDMLNKEKDHKDTHLPPFNSTPKPATGFVNENPWTSIGPPKPQHNTGLFNLDTASVDEFTKDLYSDVCARQLTDHQVNMDSSPLYNYTLQETEAHKDIKKLAYCVYCFKNRRSPKQCCSHKLFDKTGRIQCKLMRKYCPEYFTDVSS